jgi:hypothetical protein
MRPSGKKGNPIGKQPICILKRSKGKAGINPLQRTAKQM